MKDKDKGGHYKACCPFHHEETPSFTVKAGSTEFHCYGCGVGGNIIDFLLYKYLPDYIKNYEENKEMNEQSDLIQLLKDNMSVMQQILGELLREQDSERQEMGAEEETIEEKFDTFVSEQLVHDDKVHSILAHILNILSALNAKAQGNK